MWRLNLKIVGVEARPVGFTYGKRQRQGGLLTLALSRTLLVAAVAFALLCDRLRLCPTIRGERAADVVAFAEGAVLSPTDVALVAFMWLDEFARRSRSPSLATPAVTSGGGAGSTKAGISWQA